MASDCPVIISYSTTPKAQMSARLSTTWPRACSGAIYQAVLRIAAREGAGLRETFGTMTKPFHAGRAVESGTTAADLAALEWTAAEQILEAPRDFFRAAGGGYDPNAIPHKLGRPWTFHQHGSAIKPILRDRSRIQP